MPGLPTSAKANLTARVQKIMRDVCSSRTGTMKHAPRIETDFTGAFVRYGLLEIHRELIKALGPHNISVNAQAVYIHQSPMVDIFGPRPPTATTSKCELGDVLLVLSHRRNRWKRYWRAALWQLKIDDGKQNTPDEPQFSLYNKWPIFEVYRGGLQRGARDFARDRRSGYYGLVSAAGWSVCPPVGKIGPLTPGIIDSGRFIVEMMYAVDPAQVGRSDKFGRRVFTVPTTPLGWSDTIWELLNVTGAKQFNARRLFDRSQPRLSFLYSSTLIGRQPPDSGAPAIEGEDRGLIVVRIETDASDMIDRHD